MLSKQIYWNESYYHQKFLEILSKRFQKELLAISSKKNIRENMSHSVARESELFRNAINLKLTTQNYGGIKEKI